MSAKLGAWYAATREDLVGLLLCLAVFAGIGAALLNPATVSHVITLRPVLVPPTVVLSGWVVALGVLINGTLLRWWGPVRVPRPMAIWQLSGSADRSSTLARRRNAAVLAAGLGCVLLAIVVSILDVGSAPILGAVGVLCAAAITGAAMLHQQRQSRAMWTGSSRGRLTLRSPARLHRDVFAPDDGLGASLVLAIVMMDLDWIHRARTVRWQRANILRHSYVWPSRRLVAFIVADATRLLRRRGDIGWWTVVVAIGCSVPLTLNLSTWEPMVAAVLAYRAGGIVAGGLRQVVSQPALARALGGTTRQLRAGHAVLPIAGVLVWVAITAQFWHMSAPVVISVAAGAIFAVVRRATRSELPFDAPVYLIGPLVVQPLLMFAILRGPLAVVITGVTATAIGVVTR